MIAHKEAVLRGDEGLAKEFQGSTHIQGIGLMHAHPWMLIKTGVLARSCASFHERSSFLLDGMCSCSSMRRDTYYALLGVSAFRHGDIAPGE
jgi:hypothetical protein